MNPSRNNAAARRRVRATHATLFAAVIFSLLAGGAGFGPPARATPPPPPPRMAGEDSATQARSALARAGAEARLEQIKDERLRRAAQTAYRALAEIAGNDAPAKSAPLGARFERAHALFIREAARAGMGNCAANCEADGAACRKGCKAADKRVAGKKFCGCKFDVFACVVAECLF